MLNINGFVSDFLLKSNISYSPNVIRILRDFQSFVLLELGWVEYADVLDIHNPFLLTILRNHTNRMEQH